LKSNCKGPFFITSHQSPSDENLTTKLFYPISRNCAGRWRPQALCIAFSKAPITSRRGEQTLPTAAHLVRGI
jgi:hypothetical protein